MKTFGLATVLALLLVAPAVAATDENIGISIETLLKDGWQIAGYAAANQSAVESAMILLRHADQWYLVQCRAVQASPRIATSCTKRLASQSAFASKVGSLAMLLATRRASSSEIFLVRLGTRESVMTFWLVASA
jgi:hypothetical protein